jgi:ribosomal protein L29
MKESKSTAIKGFKAVDFVREVRRKSYEETKGMSSEELKKYFKSRQKSANVS